MSQIQIPNIRTGTDVPMKVRLTDSGVRIDWATLDNIAAYIYSEAQMVIAGKCSDIHVDPEDNTALLVEYPYTENQFLGVQRLVIVADYQGQHCTFDRKAFCFVATTDETGESTTVEDDTVEVDITVDDVDSSILSAAIRAALAAADLAEEKADAANDAATLANEKAGFAQEKGEYAKAQGDYAKEQIDGAKGEYKSLDGRFDAMEETIPNDIIRTASDASFVHHTSARNTHLFYLREATTLLAGLMTAADKVKLSALPTAEELSAAILAITNLIPAQASAENQLADKAFVNSSISTATATFRGTFNLVSDLHLTISASQSDISAALASAISGADNNDYSFVQIPTKNTKPNEIARIDRYKYNGTAWSFEYSLNNSSFTEAQWAALNSGITSAAVAKLSELPTMSELETLLGAKVNVSDIVDNLLSNESTKPLSAKQGKVLDGKVSQLGQEVEYLDVEINSCNKVEYQLEGQLAYYKANGTLTGWNGVGTYTEVLQSETRINQILFPPFRTFNNIKRTVKYLIGYGNTNFPGVPVNKLTTIAQGTIDNVKNVYIEDYKVDLQNPLTIPAGNRVYVLLYCDSSSVYLLGGGNNASATTLPALFSQNDAIALLYAVGSAATPFEQSWSVATVPPAAADTALYRVCNPILKLVIEGRLPKIEQDLETLQEDVETLQEDVETIITDIDETKYVNEGEWEHYNELNKYVAWRGTGTHTPLLEQDTKINCICIPKFSTANKINIKYWIGYRAGIGSSFKPSEATTLKSGIFEDVNGAQTGVKIFLDNPVTVPAGNSVHVLLYSDSTIHYANILGGGMVSTETLPYNNDTPRANLYTGTNWDNPWGETWPVATNLETDQWKVCSPILKLEQKSLIERKIDAIVPDMINEELEEQVPELVDEALEEENAVAVHLPNKLYAVVGDTLQLFFQGIVAAIDLEQYDIYVVCDKGKTYPRYFSYTPTIDDIGTNTLTIYVKDRKNNILGQASCSLVTVAAPVSPNSLKSIFTFGDSLTSPGIWVGEAKRRLVGNTVYDGITGKGLSNLSFFGYMSKTIHEQPVNYYGVGGWTWVNYITKAIGGAFRFYVSGVNQLSIGAVYTNNGYSYTIQEINVTGDSGNIRCTTSANTNVPSASGTLTKTEGEGDATITFDSFETENLNPLWDDVNNKMSFVPYVQDCGANTIDAVYVLLTWNGHSAWKEYSANDTTGHIANAKIFARTLHAEYPNARLFIMGIQMPSNTGGLGANYGATGGLIDGYGVKQCALNYNKALQDLCNLEEFSSYCEFVAIAPQFDTHYNMPYTMAKVNIRNSATEMLGLNGVHPSEQGYNQIADAVYRSIVANYCH